MSTLCEWNVKNNTNIGSDHFPILCSMNFDMYVQEGYVIERFVFLKLIGKNVCVQLSERKSMEGVVDIVVVQ